MGKLVKRGAGWVLVGAVGAGLALTAVACSDSIHLDPKSTGASAAGTPTGSGGSTSTSTGSAGGNEGGGGAATTTTTSSGGGTGCKSNADCPDDPAAPQAAICDVAYNKCVECLVYSDCQFRPGTTCAKGSCVCPTPGESYCGPLAQQGARCVDLQTNPADCGTCGYDCFTTCGAGKCTDAWEPTGLMGAPAARTRHVAVWTDAKKMVIWGGEAPAYTSTGGIYNPATRSWTQSATAGAPSPRSFATALWMTGAATPKMLVWGGYDGSALGTGAKFDPATNTWSSISTTNAPSARFHHTAVWTGAKMLVWGGDDGAGNELESGGSYDPATDLWTAIGTAPGTNGSPPTRRREHSAVWTGARMLVFGGYGLDVNTQIDHVYLGDGAIYDPLTDQWAPLPMAFAPVPRARHIAAWSGAAMIVWGGFDGGSYLSSGASYDLTNWTGMGAAPIIGRQRHTGVWIPGAGRMVTWGGDTSNTLLNDGGLFDPAVNMNSWNANPMPTAPLGRYDHTAVVTDTNKMIVWGGSTSAGATNSGAIFDPALAN